MAPLTSADLLLILLVLAMIGGALVGLRRGLHRTYLLAAQKRQVYRLVLGILPAWLLFTTSIALSGLLNDWQALPPRMALVIGPPLVALVALLRSRRIGAVLDALPVWVLLAPQVFRVAVEVLLWLLYRDGRLPVQMTFEGRNWDIVVGMSAPLVAWLVARRPTEAATYLLVRIWNGAGLLILGNIVAVALLSTPSPLRQFWNEPANTIIAGWPWVWLPGVLVPMAYMLHALSWRQVGRRK
jgi:hypothetical protein